MFLLKACIATFIILLPITAFAQHSSIDSVKRDTTGSYGGYRTWREYLAHQDTLPIPRLPVPVQLAWFTWGLGNESAFPYQFSDYAIFGELTYQSDLLMYRVRWLNAKDYNFGGVSESLDEYDALFGFGLHQGILLNGEVGIGFRHRYHYLADPYQDNLPPHTTIDYLALPMQAELLVPIPTKFLGLDFGIGVTYYASLSHEGFDHGWLIGFSVGRLSENGPSFGGLPDQH